MGSDPVQAVKAIVNPVGAVNSAIGGAIGGEAGRAVADPFGTGAQKGVEAGIDSLKKAAAGPKSAGALPEPVSPDSAPAVQAAATNERKRASRGRAANLLTGAGGITTSASTTGRTLLGS